MVERIMLSPPERRDLQRMSRSRSVRAEDARRARIILSLASGSLSLWAISRQERCSINTVRMWRARFKQQRLAGLWSRHHGRAPGQGVEKLEARIIHWTLHRKPLDGSTHWSSRKLGSALGINPMRVARVWAKAGLQSPLSLPRF
jgi:DNA-binding CsgD family transcriptional regulator